MTHDELHQEFASIISRAYPQGGQKVERLYRRRRQFHRALPTILAAVVILILLAVFAWATLLAVANTLAHSFVGVGLWS